MSSPKKKAKTELPHLWIRDEIKPSEKRTGITPDDCKTLISAGYTITVERFAERCVPDAEYESAGCTIVDGGSWTSAPKDAFIVGLKELPEDGSALVHRHIYFGHAYKNQGGWKELLMRFHAGGGTLLDMEFLHNERGQRVAAFGFMAGFCGAASALMAYASQKLTGEKLGEISPEPSETPLIEKIVASLAQAEAKTGSKPRAIIMGALGRCGSGAVSMLEKCGLSSEQIVKWDMEETKGGGPFPALLEHDIFINCIYLAKPIPAFLTEEMLNSDSRVLSVICDVSCDTSNPHNPLPFCNVGTTFSDPIMRMTPTAGPVVDVIAIDHLPTMLPLESSQHFSRDLLPTILAIPAMAENHTWVKAQKLFDENLEAAKQQQSA